MADDKTFQPGDVVGLKSGGPGMTVRDTWTDTEGRPGSTCQWFTAGEELREAGFANGMLEKRQPAADLARMEASGGCGSLAKMATGDTFAGWVVSKEWAKDAKIVVDPDGSVRLKNPPAETTRLGMPRFVAKVTAVSGDRFEAVTPCGRLKFTDVRPSRHVAGLGAVIGEVAVGDEVEIDTDDGRTHYLARSLRRRVANPKTGETLVVGVGGIQPEEPATQMSTILANRTAGKPTFTAPFGVDLNPVPGNPNSTPGHRS